MLALFLGIACGIIAVIVVLILAFDRTGDSFNRGVVVIIFCLVLFIFGTCLENYGEGILARDNLPMNGLSENQVFETLSSKKVGKKYAVILRMPDGKLRAYLLDRNPPEVFKKSSNEKDPYPAYP